MVEPATARQGRVGYPALAHLLSTRPLAAGEWWGPLPSHPISVLHLPSDGAGCPPGHRSRRAPLSFRDRSVRSGAATWDTAPTTRRRTPPYLVERTVSDESGERSAPTELPAVVARPMPGIGFRVSRRPIGTSRRTAVVTHSIAREGRRPDTPNSIRSDPIRSDPEFHHTRFDPTTPCPTASGSGLIRPPRATPSDIPTPAYGSGSSTASSPARPERTAEATTGTEPDRPSVESERVSSDTTHPTGPIRSAGSKVRVTDEDDRIPLGRLEGFRHVLVRVGPGETRPVVRVLFDASHGESELRRLAIGSSAVRSVGREPGAAGGAPEPTTSTRFGQYCSDGRHATGTLSTDLTTAYVGSDGLRPTIQTDRPSRRIS